MTKSNSRSSVSACDRFDELLALVDQLREENRLLREKLAKLEERLSQNSQNSSKFPSSEQKKNKYARRGGGKATLQCLSDAKAILLHRG